MALPDYASLTLINPESELKLSTSSTEVQTAQKMLKVIGFDPGREDGFFDEKTEQAVKDFQVKEKIEANGILTGESTTRLMQSLREIVQSNDTQLQKAVEILKEEMAK